MRGNTPRVSSLNQTETQSAAMFSAAENPTANFQTKVMSGLLERLGKEIEKGEAERRANEQNLRLDPLDPANREKIRQAITFQRKVGASLALLGAALVAVTYGFYQYTGDLYLILGLLGGVAFCAGFYQMIVGKDFAKSN